jgi:hypothetical protein
MSTPEFIPPTYTPTPTDVARLLRARTKDANGAEVGDWTDETRPTATDVADLIDQALGPVLARVGRLEDPLLGDLLPAARHAVALGAACLVEKSYYPEQVNSERSAYTAYKEEYADTLDALVGGGDSGDGDGALPGAHGGHATVWTPSATVVLAGGWSDDYWPEPENPANWVDPHQPPREPPLPGDLPVGDAPASGRWLRR